MRKEEGGKGGIRRKRRRKENEEGEREREKRMIIRIKWLPLTRPITHSYKTLVNQLVNV